MGGELGPHLTQCRLAEAYLRTKWHLDPSSRLATIYTDQKLGARPLFGAGDGSPSNKVAWAEAYLHAKFPTVSPQYSKVRDRPTGHQQSDTIGRTVLQTVAPKQDTNDSKDNGV